MKVLFGLLVKMILANSEQETQQISMFLKNSLHSSCFFCFLWIRAHINHHNRFRFMVLGKKFKRTIMSWRHRRSLKASKTSFSNISKISTGCEHSLFQNNKGEIFACGNNEYGGCGWVILILLKSYQVSFPMHLRTLFILFVDLAKTYFLIQKEMYILLGRIIMANWVLVTTENRMI